MDFMEVIHNRHSIRQFEDREIESSVLEKLLHVINSAPSAGDLQAYEVILIKDKTHIEALSQASYGQEFIESAPLVLVFCANPRKSKQKYGTRGDHLFSLQDATIAATYAQLAAVELGLSTAWVGAFDDEKVKDIVGGLRPVCIMPVGYSAEHPQKTPRRPLEDLVHYEHL